MNFYPHHIGDFNNSTRHLTRVERALYRDAIELYYDTESVLTNDFDWLARKLIATSEDEKNALKMVLNEFFEQTSSGWLHHRCEKELAKYRANASNKAKAGKASAEARRIAKQNSTRVEQPLNPVQQTKNQEPRTKNHIKNHCAEMSARFIEFWEIWPKSQRKVGKATCWKKWKLESLDSKADEIIAHVAALKNTDQWRDGFDPSPITYINQERWNDGVVANGEKSASVMPWFLMASGIEAKAVELGLKIMKDETFRDFKVRVFQAAGITPEVFKAAKNDWGIK